MNPSNERGRLPARLAPALALAVVLAAVAVFAAAAATTRTAAAPSNSSPPTIGGTAAEGDTLTANNGNWGGSTPISYSYQWQRCDSSGGSCARISGATEQTYVLASADNGSTLRVRVTASNADGSSSSTTVPTAVVAAAPLTGCPSTAAGATVAASQLSAPARLQIDQFAASPSVIPGSFSSFSIRVQVSDTCGQTVSGADVYATAVPYNQVTIPPETQTGSDGWVTLQFNRLKGFPAIKTQERMVMFLRAREPGQSPLTGIATSRLVSFKVNLKAAT